MSVRLHELARKIGMDNKDLLALLKKRDYPVKTVSSTVDKITAESLEQEFGPKTAPVPEVAAPPAPPAAPAEPRTGEPAPAVAKPPAFTTRVPAGIFVRSAQDIAREKEELARASRPSVVFPAPRPAPPSPGARVMPTQSRSPIPSAAPSRPPAALGPSRSSSPPLIPARASTPPVVSSPAAPPLPPPPSARSTPPLPPRPPAPPSAPSVTVTVSGDVKIIQLKPPVIVRDFATALGLKPFKLISELMEMGIFASMNQSVEEAVATQIAERHGFLLEVKHRGESAPATVQKEKVKRPAEDETKLLEPRPPVVCILGHVDHGKTTLLDAIRQTNVAAGETGGITQRIGAYQVEFNQRKITFLDTPGHAAFNKMRARGASVTDIAVLVVAADDGFMPQTDEALKHAQNAKVALIVAVNKMDVKGANLERVKAQMQERGIAPEDWGGETITVPVTAIKGQGIKELLEYILLQAEVLELKANPKAEAAGVIIESQVDVGRGPTATVIVQRGTLRPGDAIVCGPHHARVRAMFDDKGEAVKEAPPSTPVKLIGWSGAPDSGAAFRAVKNGREAERLAEEETERLKKEVVTQDARPKEVSVEKLFAEIAAAQEKILRLVLKCDFFGSTEAVRNILECIKSQKVSLQIISAEVGLVSKSDVLMAGAAGAVIVGFNTKLENGVTPLAKHHGVRIETFDIIYELGDKVREMMADLLEPDSRESKLGAAEVRQIFPVSRGFVAGCLVTEGRITRNAAARVRRGRETMFEGRVGTLRRFKDDASEVRAGLECGIRLDGFDGYKEGDVIECYEIEKVRASL
ncbi:MAG: translation initiation factor IF-2 [Verrucomicrobia bacterium RIFCSPLOWO2_12_FULL_64_8]|nr:MAG: translation initiation factor IF-2 [Verrucomicrobia bacterium RIFCSPLOWO2_12_FULL_64_8]